MKKKIILLAIVTSLCLSGGLSFISSGQAASPEKAQIATQKASEKELKAAKSAAIRDTKVEIGMIKSEIRTLESNLSTAKRALTKARQSEVEQREKCDELEQKLSAKKTIYKLAESRIASGNIRAADGQAALAAEMNEIEKEYTEALEQWELDQMVANDSSVVIDINKNLISQYQERLAESEGIVDDIKAGRNVDAHLQKIQSRKAAAESAAKAAAESAAKAAAESAAKAAAESAAKAAAESAAKAAAESAAKANLQNKDIPKDKIAAPQQEGAPAANAPKAKAPQEKVEAIPATPEKVQTPVPVTKTKQDIRKEKKARAKAEKQAKEAAKIKEKEQAKVAKAAKEEADRLEKEAKAAKSKQTAEARKIAEQEAKAREKNNLQPPASEPNISPNAAPNSKEQRLLELLQLYQNDKISPREYQNRRSKILEEK